MERWYDGVVKLCSCDVVGVLICGFLALYIGIVIDLCIYGNADAWMRGVVES